MNGSIVFGTLRQCAPHVTCFLGPTLVYNRNDIAIGSAVFGTIYGRVFLYVPLSPKKIAPFHEEISTQSNNGSLGPPECSTQTGPRSVLPLCRARYCDRQTDRPTDHATRSSRSVTIGRIYVRCTAMRLNK